jgi:hypothetical protein
MAGEHDPKAWMQHVRRLHEAGINDMEIFPGSGLTGVAAAERLLEVRRVLTEEFG